MSELSDWHRVSTYAGPALAILGLSGMQLLRPFAAVVAVIGTADTMRMLTEQKIGMLKCVLSVLLHVCIYLCYVRFQVRWKAVLLSLVILLGLLGMYKLLNKWPYAMPMIEMIPASVAILVTQL
tara:strand:- start:82 stop:453 length:372 start_codon:yes stop_codon:yes gene_type:complete